MQITFFVGNGFDISCGLRSSYSQFYDWYCTQEKSELDSVNSFRDAIYEDKKAKNKNWVDFEKALGQYTKHFTKTTVQDFIACYKDAHMMLMTYLESEANRFEYEKISDKDIQQLRKGLKEFFSELQPREIIQIKSLLDKYRGESRMIKFISFNYTNVLDKIVSQIATAPLEVWNNAGGHKCMYTISPDIIHTHGTLDEFPVFGVNDESQIANKELLSVKDFARLMIKPKCIADLGELWHDEVRKAIQSSTIICIFGMSLGSTDSIWFESIMDWVRADENRHIIVFWEKAIPIDKRANWQYFFNAREAIERITAYSDCTNEEIESLRSRIHYIGNTKQVLRIKLKEKESSLVTTEEKI